MGSVDANRTFEIFVKQGDTDFDKRNLADDTGRINEIFQSTGTQTVDSTQYDGNSSYFSHRENKRVDEQVRRAQRAHYKCLLETTCIQTRARKYPEDPAPTSL